MGGVRRAVARAAPWAAVVLPFAELLLVLTGVLPVAVALGVAVLLEAALAAVVVAEWVLFRRSYRQARADGEGRPAALRAGIEASAPRPLVLVLRSELGMWRALAWAVRRRRSVAPEDVVLTYSSRMGVMLWVTIALTPIEALALHLLVPWETVRWGLLALSVYGLLWMVAFALALGQRPHTLDADELVLRFAHLREAAVRVADVVAATASTTVDHRRNLEQTDGLLALSVLGETSVQLQLRPGSTVRLERAEVPAERVAFFTDDPRRAVRELRSRTAQRARD